jgi:DNA-binding NarL/FixJ family response regulator
VQESDSKPRAADAWSPARSGQIRILLVDDHEVVRIGLRQLIDSRPDLRVCGEATTVAEARAAIGVAKPNVVLLDLTLGAESGFGLLGSLDELPCTPRILVLSMFDESLYADDALALGARGYTMKDVPPDELIKAIRTVAGGNVYLSDRLAQRMKRRIAAGRDQGPAAHEALTPREQEVIELLGEALTTREIAARMGTAVKTVDSHKRNICGKLGLASAAELLRYAVINARQRPRA